MQPECAFDLIRRFAQTPYTVEFRKTCLDVISGVIMAMEFGVCVDDSLEGLPGAVFPTEPEKKLIPSSFIKHGCFSVDSADEIERAMSAAPAL
jgi:hypothetical protein